MNKQLLQQVHSLTSTVDSLNATINAQTQLIAQLNQTIQELKEQLNKNSKNSSKPPSSDGFKKPAPKSLRKPSGKKAGGQNGHQGTHLAVITAPDKIVKHMPSACEGCPHYQICKGTACIAEKRHVIDAVVTVNVTEHQALELPICMLYGDTRRGAFPSDVKAAVQYGENLQSLAVALNTVGAVSIKRTHEILSGVFNIPIATGTIWSYVKKKYKLNVTNFPFFVIVNSLSLLRPFPSFSDIVPHIHLETNIHNDYEYGLYYRMFQYIQKLVYMHECS